MDEGMEIYGGENVELGIRVSRLINLDWGHGKTMMKLQSVCQSSLYELVYMNDEQYHLYIAGSLKLKTEKVS